MYLYLLLEILINKQKHLKFPFLTLAVVLSFLPLKFYIFSPVFCHQFQKGSISFADKSIKFPDLPKSYLHSLWRDTCEMLARGIPVLPAEQPRKISIWWLSPGSIFPLEHSQGKKCSLINSIHPMNILYLWTYLIYECLICIYLSCFLANWLCSFWQSKVLSWSVFSIYTSLMMHTLV